MVVALNVVLDHDFCLFTFAVEHSEYSAHAMYNRVDVVTVTQLVHHDRLRVIARYSIVWLFTLILRLKLD